MKEQRLGMMMEQKMEGWLDKCLDAWKVRQTKEYRSVHRMDYMTDALMDEVTET